MAADLSAGAMPPAPAASGAPSPKPGLEADAPLLPRTRPADAPILIDWHGFHVALRRAALAATQSGAPLSLLMLELAGGRDAPESESSPARSLEMLAAAIATELGQAGALARYGEERLAVILMEADLGKAVLEAERIGRSLATPHHDQPPPTAAIGVAQFRDDESLGHLIERVSAAVGRAKSADGPVAIAEHQLRRRRRPAGDSLCPCGLYACPCACGLSEVGAAAWSGSGPDA